MQLVSQSSVINKTIYSVKQKQCTEVDHTITVERPCLYMICLYISDHPSITCPGYDNDFFPTFLLAWVAKLVAHARFLKSTILIKIGDIFVKWILKGRKCDKSTK